MTSTELAPVSCIPGSTRTAVGSGDDASVGKEDASVPWAGVAEMAVGGEESAFAVFTLEGGFFRAGLVGTVVELETGSLTSEVYPLVEGTPVRG